jgi:hypothetical protein
MILPGFMIQWGSRLMVVSVESLGVVGEKKRGLGESTHLRPA